MNPIPMFRATTQRFHLTAEDDSGVAVDLTGGKLWFTAKKSPTDLDAAAVFVLTSDVSGGVLILDAEAGLAVATAQPSNTTALAIGKLTQLFYEWKFRNAANEPSVLETGTILVRPNLTQAT